MIMTRWVYGQGLGRGCIHTGHFAPVSMAVVVGLYGRGDSKSGRNPQVGEALELVPKAFLGTTYYLFSGFLCLSLRFLSFVLCALWDKSQERNRFWVQHSSVCDVTGGVNTRVPLLAVVVVVVEYWGYNRDPGGRGSGGGGYVISSVRGVISHMDG